MSFLLISDSHRFSQGRNKVTKTLRKAAEKASQTAIKSLLVEQLNSGNLIGGRVSRTVLNHIPENYRPLVKVFGEDHLYFAEKVDFKTLRGFSKNLDELSYNLTGFHTFSLFIIRWLDPIVNHFCAYVEQLIDLKEKNPNIAVSTLTQASFIERLARMIFLQKISKTSLRSTVLSTFLKNLQRIETRSKLWVPFDNIVSDWKTFCDEEPNLNPVGKKSKPRVLFIGYKPRTLQRLQSLIPVFQKENKVEVCVLGVCKGYDKDADRIFKDLQEQGVKIAWASEYVGRFEVDDLLLKGRRAVRETRSKFESSLKFVYKGLDLTDEVKSFLTSVFEKGSQIAPIYELAATRSLSDIEPDAIVHFEDWEINRAICLASQPKVTNVSYYVFSPLVLCDMFKRLPQKAAVSGQYLKSGFSSSLGWPENDITIVGDPAVDLCANISKENSRQKLNAQFGFDVSKKLILVIANYADEFVSSDDYTKFYAKALEYSKAAGFEILVKAHPQQNFGQLENLLKSLGYDTNKLVQHADLLELSAGCDVALVTHTTATNHILMAKTPVLSILPSGTHAQLDKIYHYSDAGIPVLSLENSFLEDLKKSVLDLDWREGVLAKARLAIEEHVGPIDGQSAQRMCSLVVDLCYK
ncbi:MAG: hypothetical protein AB7F43_04100 [Bacteriovoracia bacterium]